MKRLISILACSMLLILLLPVSAMALGVAIGPQIIEIGDALRGGEYERAITIFNPSPAECSYQIGAEGDIASWLTFYDRTTQKAIQHLLIAGESNTTLIFKVNVPGDVVNQSYTATIFAQTAPDAGSSGASAVLRSTSVLTVKVSGEQVMKGSIGTITVKDTEAGLPMRVQVNFQNTGNVAAQPKIECQVTKGNDQVANFTYDKSSVKPNSQDNIPVEWATTNATAGDYVSKVTVSLDGKVLATQTVPFKILPAGTLTKTGEFTNLTFDGQPVLDSMIKIQSQFKSTGQADVLAKLIGEVYYGGSLVDKLNSEQTMVPVGQTGTLTAYLKLQKTGEYTVKAYVSYEGKQTDVKEIKVNVASAQPISSQPKPASAAAAQPGTPPTQTGSTGQISFNPIYLAAILGGVVLIVAVILIVLRRR